jgi:hypothetical protein
LECVKIEREYLRIYSEKSNQTLKTRKELTGGRECMNIIIAISTKLIKINK